MRSFDAPILPMLLERPLNVDRVLRFQLAIWFGKWGNCWAREIRVETELNRTRPPEARVERLLADNTQAKAILNWAPAISLDEGLISTAD